MVSGSSNTLTNINGLSVSGSNNKICGSLSTSHVSGSNLALCVTITSGCPTLEMGVQIVPFQLTAAGGSGSYVYTVNGVTGVSSDARGLVSGKATGAGQSLVISVTETSSFHATATMSCPVAPGALHPSLYEPTLPIRMHTHAVPACSTGTDACTTRPWVVCTSSAPEAWLSATNFGYFNPVLICQSLGYSSVGVGETLTAASAATKKQQLRVNRPAPRPSTRGTTSWALGIQCNQVVVVVHKDTTS